MSPGLCVRNTSVLTKDGAFGALPLLHVKVRGGGVHLRSPGESSPHTKSAVTWTLACPASRTVKNSFLMFINDSENALCDSSDGSLNTPRQAQ